VQVSEVTRSNATAQGAAQRHELFVTQAPVDKVSLALRGRGLAQAAPGGGVVVKPAFSLDEAMSVSRQLTADGFNVVIRPAGGVGDSTVHVVRAGGYPDRARAIAARNALKAKGIDGFVAEGSAR
jgi:cell division septation protein DedD